MTLFITTEQIKMHLNLCIQRTDYCANKARIAVMKIFQKALLCNGMFGANRFVQNKFKDGVDGHLTAIRNLHRAMEVEGDRKIPALFEKNDLRGVKIRKLHCTIQ
jgi:hypothetical protein